MKNGKTGICSTVYSLGFILPTIFGPLVYQESFSGWDLLGILIVIPVIILAGTKKSVSEKKGKGYFIPLVIAMVCSGGLGIMQKVQQRSACADERVVFMLLAFSFATVYSLIGFCLSEKKNFALEKKAFSGIGIGLAFAGCNLLNTILAGRLPSTVFFPVLNVGTILFSMILGVMCFKEKLTKKDLAIFSLGVIAILFIAIG
ncbi:MAG: EamA family transporter [Clostridia bacterium]|nr:EamA family transporter [Clostridia bacterium]